MTSSMNSGPGYETPQMVYHQVVRPQNNSLATAALVLGIIAIVSGVWMVIPIVGLVFAFISFAPAVLAVIFGATGLRQANRINVGRGAAITGLTTGGLTLAIGLLTTVFWIVALAASAASHSGS